MLKAWVRWGSALVPTAVSASVTSYLLTTGNWEQWGIKEVATPTPSSAFFWSLKELAPVAVSPGSFADLASITFTSDCISQGRVIETCDPSGRPFQPYVVLPARVLATLGLGAESTETIGMILGFSTVVLVAGLSFLLASEWKRGGASLIGTQLALAIGAISPGVILGIERGQIEILTALLIVTSLLTLHRPTFVHWLGAVCSIAATTAKYFTVGMFLAFANRETFTRRNWAVLISAFASGAFLLLSTSDLRQAAQASRSGTPQTTMSAFGLTNTIATPLSGSALSCCPPAEIANAWPTLRLIGLSLFLATVAGAYLFLRRVELPSPRSTPWTLTIGSGGVLLLPYLLGSSHDYRLVFLLPLIAGAGLWWNSGLGRNGDRVSIIFILAATFALVTSASMLPTPQGWRWPVWLVVFGDIGLFGLLALTAGLAVSMALRQTHRH